jgi:NOL1/NOP2/fmu family ribosome biogenesis protein
MANQRFLNSRKVKEIHAMLEAQWGVKDRLDYAFLENDEGNIYIVSRDIERIDMDRLRINSIGMYFGEVKHGELRLSIEGSQLIGPKAIKNILEIDEAESKQWMLGHDLEKDAGDARFVIIRHGKDFMGTGRVKEGRVLNYIPKIRRLNATH